MSDKGTGNTETVEFTELDLEEDTAPSKEEQLATFLKEKLSETDFSSAAKILGLEEELSNTELLEKILEALGALAPPEEKEKPEEEDTTLQEEEGDGKSEYKAFIKQCMADGKTLQECTAAYKEQNPAPTEKAGEGGEELEKLASRVAELEGTLKLERITNEVDGLVQAKHLSPRQKPAIIKLSARLNPADREAFLEVFKSQKFTVSQDVGQTAQTRPGGTESIDAETRARIMKTHGLASLIEDKAVKRNN